jgi:histidine ammonia-lyase
LSHSCGVGDYLSEDDTRSLILVRANNLAKGYSGIRLEVIEALLNFLNNDVYPLIPCQGSVGASGDLAPLAHLAMALTGEGSGIYKGKRYNKEELLYVIGQKKINLKAKEGLALINGTSFLTGISLVNLIKAENLVKNSDIISAMSIEALNGTSSHYDHLIVKARNHKGAIKTASNIRKLIKNSRIISSHRNCPKIQDPYCLRCIPQVHGASKDFMSFFKTVLINEINSATDNPLIFPDNNAVLSGGNFHGAPVALNSDAFAIALSYLGSISERRIDRLLNPFSEGKSPKFLTKYSGICSGLMISQYTAASLVSENKVLSHPASTDTIPTSAGFEDHVSMGAWSSRKARMILNNIEKILGIELLNVYFALSFRKKYSFGAGTDAVFNLLLKKIDLPGNDRDFSKDIEKSIKIVTSGELVRAVEKITGRLDSF